MSSPDRDIISRLREFIKSAEFAHVPEESLSEYWKYFQDTITFTFENGSVDVQGASGIYTPRARRSLFQKLGSLVISPRAYSKIVFQQLLRRAIHKSGMTFELVPVPIEIAFDAVMNIHPMSDYTRSPYRLDIEAIGAMSSAFRNSSAVAGDYLAFSQGIPPNDEVFIAYYYMNIFSFLGLFDDDFSYVEIGAGNGNLSSQLLRHRKKTSYIVDLPRTLVGSIAFLTKMHSELNIVMPHEAKDHDPDSADLVFLTPAQIDLIPTDSLSFAVNTDSFQEMTPSQVETYFAMIDRTVRPSGHFFTANRVEKIPGNPDTFHTGSQANVMRFSDYPWRESWVPLVHQVCPLSRLISRDNSFVRLSRI